MNQVKKDYQELSGRLAFTPNGSPVVICGYSKPLGFLVGAIQESPEGWHEQLDLKHKIRISRRALKLPLLRQRPTQNQMPNRVLKRPP